MKEAVAPDVEHIWLVNPKGAVVSVPIEWWDMKAFKKRVPYTGANAAPAAVEKWYATQNPKNKALHASYHPLPPYRLATEAEIAEATKVYPLPAGSKDAKAKAELDAANARIAALEEKIEALAAGKGK